MSLMVSSAWAWAQRLVALAWALGRLLAHADELHQAWGLQTRSRAWARAQRLLRLAQVRGRLLAHADELWQPWLSVKAVWQRAVLWVVRLALRWPCDLLQLAPLSADSVS